MLWMRCPKTLAGLLWVFLVWSCTSQVITTTAWLSATSHARTTTAASRHSECSRSIGNRMPWWSDNNNDYGNRRVRECTRFRGGSSQPSVFTYSSSSTEKQMISAAATSLLAGSLAGAVGVGIAFPLDTLKTKAQVMETETKLTMTQVVRAIYKQDGLKGFFGGVKAMMLGQAVIKSVAFGCNAMTLAFLQQQFPNFAAAAPAVLLFTAACFAGFVASFFVTPVERIKVMMQASSGGTYSNEIDCLRAILRREGWRGLFSRGLGPTILRETPSYGIYFFIYGYLMQTPLAAVLGAVAPLIFGAASGCACWIPVYPVDVVKTIVQNTEGDDMSSLQVAHDLYANGGIGAFFDGLTPKMLRAAVNHAVTFFVYDLVQSAVTGAVMMSS